MDAVSGATERPLAPPYQGGHAGGMKIYTVEARRMPRYFRVSYHQKWPRTHFICQITTKASSSNTGNDFKLRLVWRLILHTQSIQVLNTRDFIPRSPIVLSNLCLN